MDIANFIAFLDKAGIRYKEKSKAISLQDCPSCGSETFKVDLYKDEEKDWNKLYGKCHKCQEEFDSYGYLIDIGQDRVAVKALHNFAGKAPENFDTLDILGEVAREKAEPPKFTPTIHSVDHLTSIGVWGKHPASKYATSRGVTPELFDDIMIDHRVNAVAFLCREKGDVVGYQYRLVKPEDPSAKSWNPPSFKKNHHVLHWKNSGPIAICEGPFTAVAAYNFGFEAICTFGAAVSIRQMDLIYNIIKESNKETYVAFDKDAAGVSGYFALKRSLKGINVERILPEVGNDLNDSWDKGKGWVKDDSNLDFTIPVLKTHPFKSGYED